MVCSSHSLSKTLAATFHLDVWTSDSLLIFDTVLDSFQGFPHNSIGFGSFHLVFVIIDDISIFIFIDVIFIAILIIAIFFNN